MMRAQVNEIRRASRIVVRELGFFRSLYADTGVTSFQAHILIELAAEGPMGVTELAEKLRADLPTCSRAVRAMAARKWLITERSREDARQKRITLAPRGKKLAVLVNRAADAQVQGALAFLGDPEREAVEVGLRHYSRALKMAAVAQAHQIRPIRREDDAGIRDLIIKVLGAFNETPAEVMQMLPELESLSAHFGGKRRRYFVVERTGAGLVGGAGIGPLQGGAREVCELQKMYLSPRARGLGLGRMLLDACLDFARSAGYRQCYLDTRSDMAEAIRLYEKAGFKRLEEPLVNTGHFTCDAYFILGL